MPRLIDHAAREVWLAEAAWRVMARDGIAAVTVRRVAAEADLATASLRRSFPTQSALLAFCLELVRQRAAHRVRSLGDGAGPLALLEEVLPLDAPRRLEMEVFLHLGSRAMLGGELRPAYAAAHADVGRLVGLVLDAEREAGRLAAGLQLPAEIRRLHALVDGLALHLVRQEPGADTRWATEVLAAHLRTLQPPSAPVPHD